MVEKGTNRTINTSPAGASMSAARLSEEQLKSEYIEGLSQLVQKYEVNNNMAQA